MAAVLALAPVAAAAAAAARAGGLPRRVAGNVAERDVGATGVCAPVVTSLWHTGERHSGHCVFWVIHSCRHCVQKMCLRCG